MNEPFDGAENTNADTNLNADVNSKNNKGKKIFIGLFILVVLCVITGATYIANMATPKKVFESSLDKAFKSINTTNDVKTIVGDLKIGINVDTEEKNDLYDIINNMTLKFNYALDYENQKLNLDLDSSFKSKNLITAHAYIKNDNAYVFLDKIFNKYIQVPLEDYSEIFNNKDLSNKFQIVASEVKKALDKSLKDEYFKSEKTTLTINNKKTDVTKNILNLNKENFKSLSKDIAAYLNNDTFIKNLADLTKTEESDIKDAFEEVINNDIEEFNDIYISIYTTGMIKKVVALEINDNTDKLLITLENDSYYKYELTGEDTFNGTIKISEKDGKTSSVITVNVLDSETNTKFSINLEMSFKYNEKVEDIDTSNYISYDNLTEVDQSTIMMNLMSNEGIVELMEVFSKMNSDDYTDYYDTNETDWEETY